MLTLAQALAIISILISFGVPQATVDEVSVMIMPVQEPVQEVITLSANTIIQETMPKPPTVVTPLPVTPAPQIPPTVKTVSEIGGSSHYKLEKKDNETLTYKSATVKVWKTATKAPLPVEVSVELYLGENLVSKGGHWSQEGHLVEGKIPFVLNSDIGSTQETALTVEMPIEMTVHSSTNYNIRTEVHGDTGNNGNDYQAVLVSLNQ